MAVTSAGLLMWEREADKGVRVFLVHPGGPWNRNKDEGMWGIPKGMVEEGEDFITAARREFVEETSFPVPDDGFFELGSVYKARSSKTVHAWAFERKCDLPPFGSNCFKMEWPPKSGKFKEFPENDRGQFFDMETARAKINPGEAPLLDRLMEIVSPRI